MKYPKCAKCLTQRGEYLTSHSGDIVGLCKGCWTGWYDLLDRESGKLWDSYLGRVTKKVKKVS